MKRIGSVFAFGTMRHSHPQERGDPLAGGLGELAIFNLLYQIRLTSLLLSFPETSASS